ncbi:TPA: hypothetical protein JG946_003746 [Enterobacter hormaechei subsp. steigerwaltii]|nr:hypothetical protein [Enterobacter hormaechei subsp. steigerwaltii]
MLNSKLPVPAMPVRNISYKGYPITITCVAGDTFIYEMAENQRIIESGNGNHILYVSNNGVTAVIDRHSLIYKELLHRIMHGTVLEDGTYSYSTELTH